MGPTSVAHVTDLYGGARARADCKQWPNGCVRGPAASDLRGSSEFQTVMQLEKREREREKGVETDTSFRSSRAEINTTFVFIFVSVNTMDVFASGGRERSLPK